MPQTTVQWEVTNRCNLRCKHCLPLSGNPRANELSSGEAKSALEKFSAAGATHISFTGGEAFSRADFLELVQETVAMGMRVAVITNATLLDERTLSFVKQHIRELGISLDGANAATNDFIRGKGTFSKVMNTIQMCNEAQIPIRLHVTVTKRNIGEIEELARIARTHCSLGILLSEMNLAGRALQFRNELALSANEQKTLPAIVRRVVRNVFEETLSPPDDDCWVSPTTIYMTAEGNLYSCIEIFQRRPDLAIGNIRSLDLEWWQQKNAERLTHQNKCCYSVYVSERVVFVANSSPVCAFASLSLRGMS